MAVTLRPRIPTSVAEWRLVGRTVRLVLSLPQYVVLATGYAVLGLSMFVFSRNVALLQQVVFRSRLPWESRATVIVELYPFVGTAYTALQGTVLLLTAVLIGINLSVATYHVREHRLSVGQGSGSLGGIVLGTLGAGCAACGSAVLAGLLSVAGASGLLLALPLDGLEFSVLAVVMLLLSLYWLADGMRGGEIAGCPLPE
ncbi:hypothetical protein [Haloarcula sp. 1CSR25-25]|jgi:hypothetical protein|uniref:hypothetical protein n=1 Tax=Haloarcula sp. 1CSR25-25 TaxID=2862545 RepID=UPI002894BB42|nr:hypothetical protein [Haloarcula sp. 1CSR25-25]MDT3437625.1 hypothetical protein [Haloarcula sp. 1CSR25-25]